MSLRRRDIRMMLRIYRAEERLVEQADNVERDALALAACRDLLLAENATDSAKRGAVNLMEKVNTRLDNRFIALTKNNTERMKIKAQVASTAVRSWNPNGYPQPEPNAEWQALIDGAGDASEQSKPPPDPELQELIDGAGSDQESDVEGEPQ